MTEEKPKEVPYYEVILVGGGFGSFTTMNKLRKQGFQCKIFEKGASSGGIWYWNQYPGARVDSDTPIYQLFDKELWEDFTFQERYAGWKELKRYFDHVEKKWDLKKDIIYNKAVEGARFNEEKKLWDVECADGSHTLCKWFLPCVGFAAKKFTPYFPGTSDFEGEMYHTAVWPQWGVKLEGKRIAIFGTGASGIQTIQETCPQAKHVTVYLRTPNMCLPMNQHNLDPKEEQRKKDSGEYEEAFKKTRSTFAGFTYDFQDKNTFDDSAEEREKFYDHLWKDIGGFAFWLHTYKDMLFDPKANQEAYNYWRKHVLARLKDPEKQRILAPETPPHPWGTKRPSLEQNFYEAVDQPHVSLVWTEESEVQEITTKGIKSKNEGEREFDMIIFATGFDAVTGSLKQLDIRGTDGRTIKEHWDDHLRTGMGIAMEKFPNMFFLYGPQAPTAFSNGPSCTQFQAEWVEKAMAKAKNDGVYRMEVKKEWVDDWVKRCHEAWDASLFPQAKSWYSGANVPGKKVEPLNWAGGMVAYVETLDKSIQNDFDGWDVEKS